MEKLQFDVMIHSHSHNQQINLVNFIFQGKLTVFLIWPVKQFYSFAFNQYLFLLFLSSNVDNVI